MCLCGWVFLCSTRLLSSSWCLYHPWDRRDWGCRNTRGNFKFARHRQYRLAAKVSQVECRSWKGQVSTHAFFFFSFDSSLKCSSGSLDIKCRPCRLKRILSLPTCAKARGDTEYTVSGLIAHFRNCTNCFPTWGLFEPVIFHYRQQATF